MVRHLISAVRIAVIAASILAPTASLATTQNDLNSAIDDTVFYDPTDSCVAGQTSTTTLIGNDNETKAMNYFLGKGLTKYQSAAIIGNLMQESGVNPNAVQPGGPGMGIAQWSIGGRWDTTVKDNLVAFAAQSGASDTDLATQLDFMWFELTGPFSSVLTNLKSTSGTTTTDLSNMVTYFANNYEVAKIIGPRLTYAEQALGLSATATAGSTTASCETGVVVCNNNSTSGSTGNLSQTRQNVVCIARQELAKWQSGQLTPANGYFAYSQNRVEEWCADFASWVYDQAKYPLRNDPNWNVPSVSEIQTIAENASQQQTDKFTFHSPNGYTPVPGDLAIHGGNHVNIVVATLPGGSFTLIGGDQGPGPYPGGSYVSQYSTTSAASDGITLFVSPSN